MNKLSVATLTALAYTAYTSKWTQITLYHIQQLQHNWPNTYTLKTLLPQLWHFTNKPALLITIILGVLAYRKVKHDT